MEKRLPSGSSEKSKKKVKLFPTRVELSPGQTDSEGSFIEAHYPTTVQEIQAKRKQTPTDQGGSSSGTSAADSFTRYATKLPSIQNDSSDSDIEVEATPESGQRSFSVIQRALATQTQEREKTRAHLVESSSDISTEDSLKRNATKIPEKQKQTDSTASSVIQGVSSSNFVAQVKGPPPEEFIYYEEVHDSVETIFWCKWPKCTKLFFTKRGLIQHNEIKHDTFIIYCRSCLRIYSSKDAYILHLRYYSCDIIPNVCRFCNVLYRSKIALSKHEQDCKKK